MMGSMCHKWQKSSRDFWIYFQGQNSTWRMWSARRVVRGLDIVIQSKESGLECGPPTVRCISSQHSMSHLAEYSEHSGKLEFI